jgi:hypothetical protein
MPRFPGGEFGGIVDDITPVGHRLREMNDLWDWIMCNGGRAPKVRLSDSLVRSVVATKRIQGSTEGGEEIFAIPIACLLHVKVSGSDEDFGAAFISLSQQDLVDDRTALVFLLAIERMRGSLSFWDPYINTLPVVFPSPLSWSRAELLGLAGTRLEGASRLQRTALQQQVEVFSAHFMATVKLHLASSSTRTGRASEALELVERALTRGNLTWSRSCVWSRAFSLFLSGDKSTVMVPLGDILDHSPMTNMEWLTEDDGGTVSFLSHDNISAGEVIYNNYGAKSNEELILGYGFFLRSRSLNALHLQLAVGSTSSSQHDRALRENYQFPPWYGRDMSCFLTADDPLPNPLITNVQMHCMSSIELYHFMTNIRAANDSHNHSNPVRQISILTKLHALQILSELLRTTKDRLARSKCALASCMVKDQASIRADVAETSKYYRKSQLEIVNASLKALTGFSSDEISNIMKRSHHVTSASFKSFPYIPHGITMYRKLCQEVDADYRKWETCNGIQKRTVQDARLSSPVSFSLDGLRMTSAAHIGDVLGKVPFHAILTASECVCKVCTDVIKFEADEVSLAATLLVSAMHDKEKNGPFARWLLSSRTTASGFEFEVLNRISTLSIGVEAIQVREMYNSELAALQSAGMRLSAGDQAHLQELYARSRVIVSRQAIRLPRAAVSLRDHGNRCLALIPFLGLFPRELIGVAGEYSLNYCEIESDLNHNNIRDWHLVLKASCTLDAHVAFSYAGWQQETGTVLLQTGSTPIVFGGDKHNESDNTEDLCRGKCERVRGLQVATTVVEIQFEPRDDDILLRQQKRDILLRTGLGVVHYISTPPEPARLCEALAVCIADGHELDRGFARSKSCSLLHRLPATLVGSRLFSSPENDVLLMRARKMLRKVLRKILGDMPKENTVKAARDHICDMDWQTVEQWMSVGSYLDSRRNVLIEWLYFLESKHGRKQKKARIVLGI